MIWHQALENHNIQYFVCVFKTPYFIETSFPGSWFDVDKEGRLGSQHQLLSDVMPDTILICAGSFRTSFGQPVAHAEKRGNFFPYPGESHCSPNWTTWICDTSIGNANQSLRMALGSGMSVPEILYVEGWWIKMLDFPEMDKLTIFHKEKSVKTFMDNWKTFLDFLHGKGMMNPMNYGLDEWTL